jgi:hypothetical protein
MPSFSAALTDTFKEVVDFKKFPIMYFNMEIENFDGPFLEFAFGSPADGAQVELRVPNQCSITRDGRALAGVLWGRCQSPGGTATINIMIW